MADERREVDGGAGILHRRERLADVERRRAAVAGDDRRHTHADEVGGGGMVGDLVGVGVDVDEAGRDDEPGRVDAVGAVSRRDLANRLDASALDADVGAPRRRARAVDDQAAGDDDVELCRLSLRAGPAGGGTADETTTASTVMKRMGNHNGSAWIGSQAADRVQVDESVAR